VIDPKPTHIELGFSNSKVKKRGLPPVCRNLLELKLNGSAFAFQKLEYPWAAVVTD
jgi:hypothetical protein